MTLTKKRQLKQLRQPTTNNNWTQYDNWQHYNITLTTPLTNNDNPTETHNTHYHNNTREHT